MAVSFDPYRDWLGIGEGRAGANHYRLLGLPTVGADARQIAAAADAAIARVGQLANASQAQIRDRIVAELHDARLCLLNPAARARYDADLAARAASIPAPHKVPVARAVPMAKAVAVSSSGAHAGNVASAQPELSAALWDDSGAIPDKLETAEINDERSGSLVITSILTVVFLLPVIGGAAYWQLGASDDAAPVDDQDRAAANEPALPEPFYGDAEREVLNAAPLADVASEREARPVEPERTDADLPDRDPPQIRPPAEVAVLNDAPPGAADAATADEPANESFVRTLNLARAALAARQVEPARERLAQAKKLAASPDERQTVERLDLLAEQLGRFVEAMRQGLAKYLPAEELNVNGHRVAIIEVSPESVSLRAEGGRRDYSLATMPTALALIVARAGADEKSPAAKVFYGAFYATDPHGDRARARQMWQAAAAAGEPVEDLLALLDADALAIVREPIPEADARAAAEKRVAKDFAVTLRGARSPEQKEYLVDKLLTAAAGVDASADQYALLTEAVSRAAMAGNASRSLAAVDELARWFEVDALAIKAEALSKAAAAARDPDTARQVATAALELLDTAGDHSELARSLAATAVGAARRVRDPELLKQANQRRLAVERAAKK